MNDTVYVVDLGGTEKVVNISKLKRWKGDKSKFSRLNPTAVPFLPNLQCVPDTPTPPDRPDKNEDNEMTVHVEQKKKKRKRGKRLLETVQNFFSRPDASYQPLADPATVVSHPPVPDPAVGTPPVQQGSDPPLRRSQRNRTQTNPLQVIPAQKKY